MLILAILIGRVEEMKIYGDKCVIVYRQVHCAIAAKSELKHLPISFAGVRFSLIEIFILYFLLLLIRSIP